MQWISLPEEVEVFGRMMNEQLDLRNEVKNLTKFEENFASRKAAVTFPRPLEDYSTKDILMEEYENALPLKAFLKLGGGPFDDIIAESGLDAFLVRPICWRILYPLITCFCRKCCFWTTLFTPTFIRVT